jgi:Rod binding domain-containing protein
VSDINGIAANAVSQFATSTANQVSKQAQQSAGANSQKIQRSASDFEAILLTSWLQSAEKSFATVPGSEDAPSSDPGKSQFQSYAVQAIASALTKAGGIGLAAMIASGLEKAAETGKPAEPDEKNTSGINLP